MAKQTEATSLPVVLPQSQIDALIGAGGGASSASLLDGTLTATTAAQALPTNTCVEATAVNDPTSTVDIYVGNATSQSMRLQPGQGVTASVVNTNILYVRSVSGTARVNWFART
jgi:hypothetical protein